MTHIGIDPGKGGGIAVMHNTTLVQAVPMPDTERDIYEALLSMAAIDHVGPVTATLEFVRSSPQMGVVSAFTFGRGYGALRMALIAAKIPYDEVTPIRWQNAMRCRSRGDKNVTKARAQEIFPGEKVTHAIADAMLLAEYDRRSRQGLL